MKEGEWVSSCTEGGLGELRRVLVHLEAMEHR